MNTWDKLTQFEKAEVMKIALDNGIYNLDTIRDAYNEYAEGGDIHIKPENRGKFTALKERTGHSATWFKEHGTPAQKKMAIFALNSRHWKHGLGGNLYDGTSEDSQQMRNGKYFATNSRGDSYYVSPSAIGASELIVTTPEVFVTANPDDVARGNAQRWWREHSNVYGEKGLEQVSPEFDLIGLAPLVKPIVNTGLRSAGRIIGKTNRLTNSPLTGNWTKIGNREYRLSPNSLGVNGVPIESRAITPQITSENAANITPEQWTAAQDAAIAKTDMNEAQRLRDLHSALTPTTTPGKYYRGTQTKHISYPDRHIDEEVGEMNGIYMTKNPKYAKTYGDVEEFYLRSNNPLNTEGSWTGVIDDATRTRIENSGYDAIVNNRFDTGFLNKLLRNSRDETITFNGKNLKSADAVTYDDNGVRIPLGERDNFKLNDIRYGLLPFSIGLTGYSLSQKRLGGRIRLSDGGYGIRQL